MCATASENQQFGFQTRSNSGSPVHAQKLDRGLKFRIWEEEVLYYLCSKNKDADQLCSYCTADLRLCFCIYKMLIFLRIGSNVIV